LAASPTSFDTTRLRFGDIVAGIGGVVLFLSLFLDWFSITSKAEVLGQSRETSVGVSGWSGLSFIDILLLIIALVAIAIAVLRALNMMPSLPVTPGMILLGLGGLAVLLVLFRLIFVPDFGTGDITEVSAAGFKASVDTGRSFGIFIGLLAAVAVAVGGWLTWTEEGKPMPSGAGGGAPGGAGGAIGGGQPAAGGYAQPPVGGQTTAAAPPAAAPVAADPNATAAAPPAAAPAQPADWYPDPRGEKRLRYWDGSQWTDHTAD
jgi:hypothetical protein